MQFSKKNIIIVGGTSGIGLVTAKLLNRQNANVILIGRDKQKGEQALSELNQNCSFYNCDICNEESVKEVFAQIQKKYINIHYSINNAGITSPYMYVEELSEVIWGKLLRNNVIGIANCLKYEVPILRNIKNGAIVNVSSCAGVIAMAGQAPYAVSKAALNMLTQVAALENAVDKENKYAIRVNAIAPGPTLGGMNTPEKLQQNPEKTKRKIDITAMKRFANPEEIAQTILWLLSDYSSYVTGQIISVDGGYSAGKQ
ncbi:NAD(P)-dependent dehydrogenase [Commensalibacter communis]|uniref:SDR family NAD(P)-dependent oxidoreductase n=1 Tax=Commensalibacter communis TaxID=2972786 RepID=UPI0022FFA410|nr:SDR family oxidoreductase [Commensalibacter communis]CAI3959614.1 NAD(P)-dependent dehydrogenase [Commensalibacter communis]